MTDDDKQLPVMQRPDYVYRARKHIVARNVLPGDRIQPGPRSSDGARWTVEAVRLEPSGLVKVRYVGRKQFHALAMADERVYVDRADP